MSEEKELIEKRGVNRQAWIGGVAAGVVGLILAMFLGLNGKPLIYASWLLNLVCPVAVFLAVVIWKSRAINRNKPDETENALEYSQIAAWSLLVAVVLYLFSGSVDDPRFYFLRWMPCGESDYFPIYKYGAVRFGILAAIFIPILICCLSRVSMWVIVFGILIWAQIWSFNQLWHVTGGRPLYGDAHASFMYRLWVYSQSFPRLIYYDPLWNAGTEASSLVSSGIIPVGTLLLPLWKFLQVDLMYTPVLALAFMVIVPALAGLSVRIAGGGWTAAGCAAVLALGVSQYFFLWFLSIGSVGACFALPFIMLVSACLYRVLWLDGFENSTGILFVFALVMFLAWPPAVTMALVFPAVVLFNLRQWSLRKVMFLLLCMISAAVICLPFVVGVLGHVDPPDLLHVDMTSFSVREGWDRLAGHLRQANPCLVFFGMIGVWFLPQKGVRAVFGVIIAGLAFLAGWGGLWNPHLHLSRAALPLVFVSIIPAALWMEKWLENSTVRMVLVRAMLLSILVLGGFNSTRIYGNKGPAKYVTMSPFVEQFTDWLRKNTPEKGRVLLAGCATNEYWQGRVAFLPVMADREMMAIDHFNSSRSAAGHDYPVSPVDGNEGKLSDFINLYNINYVITCDDDWRKFLSQDRSGYEEIKTFGDSPDKTVFKVNRKPDQFVSGSGRVKAGINELVVTVDNPLEEAVLRYNWEDGLTVEAPAMIKPFDMGGNVRFIAVNPHGKSTIMISYKKLL